MERIESKSAIATCLNGGGFLYGPDGTRVLRYLGIDGQQRYTLNRRLRH
jgi:hypothetical protein